VLACVLLLQYETLEEVQEALRRAGLESSNLIVALDYTKSNTWTYVLHTSIFFETHVYACMSDSLFILSAVGETRLVANVCIKYHPIV
jgi:hypothetical protein